MAFLFVLTTSYHETCFYFSRPGFAIPGFGNMTTPTTEITGTMVCANYSATRKSRNEYPAVWTSCTLKTDPPLNAN